MKVKITIDKDFSKLEKLVKNISKDNYIRLGILGNSNSRNDGMTNASIGALHEFGSISKNIPERSFLRMPIFQKQKELYSSIQAILKNKIETEGENFNKIQVLKLIGILGENIIRDAFLTGGFGQWKPLSAQTLANKENQNILIDSKQLMRSITSDVK